MDKELVEKKLASKGTNLDKLRQAFKAQQDEGGGGNYNWWKPQWQDNVVRILPAMDPEDVFFHPTARHRVNGEFYYCLKYDVDPETGRGKKCPICEARTRLFRSGDVDLIKIAKDIKAKKQFLMNLIDRASEDPARVYVYAAGVKIYNKIVSTMLDDDIDITDVDNGFDFIVKKEEGPKSEAGQFPAYDNSRAKRKSEPLHKDPEVAQKILDGRNTLKAIPRFDDAERLQAAVDGYIQSLTDGTAKSEQFFEGEGDKTPAPAGAAPSAKAQSHLADFRKKLTDSLRAEDDEEDEN